MATNRNLFTTALLAFAGGLAAGLLFAPESGRTSREKLAARIRAERRRLERQIQALEEQLGHLEEQIVSAGHEMGERVREAAHRAEEQITPDLPDDPEAFKVDDEEMAQDLRRMPRR
ncbi:MAG: YtxH domain-containing protein [Bacteroidetes bacterium]|nr:MAG: YtxH domain-containing protein [Bacteroidota bacterium]